MPGARTLEAFCSMLGMFAGNIALTLGATGAVYLGGGIVPRFADLFATSGFRVSFERKGTCEKAPLPGTRSIFRRRL